MGYFERVTPGIPSKKSRLGGRNGGEHSTQEGPESGLVRSLEPEAWNEVLVERLLRFWHHTGPEGAATYAWPAWGPAEPAA